MDTTPDRSPLAALSTPMERLDLDPHTTALFVVDLQYFDAHRDWGEGLTAKQVGVADRFEPYFARVDEILPRVQDLLRSFRSVGAEVVHVRVAERTADARDVATKQLVRGLIVPSTSKEAEFLEEVAPEGDELVFDKSSSGMFPVTNVDRIMRNLGATTLVFTGTSTGGCVESAVRDAIDLGYRVVVVDDACADSTPEGHHRSLARMAGPTCAITTTSEVVRSLEQAPKRDRKAVAGTERVKPFLPRPGAHLPEDADPYELIFPPCQKVDLNTTTSALIVLDAQTLTIDPDGPLLSAVRRADPEISLDDYIQRVDTALSHLHEVLTAAHESGLQVIHVRTGGRTRGGRDLSPALKAMVQALPLGDHATDIDTRLPRHDNDLLLTKPGQGPFTGTGLDDTLRHLGVTNLVITGVSLLGSVEAAVRGATDRGYGVLLVPEACAAATAVGQDAYTGMESGLIEVATAAQAATRIAASG